jgi:ribonuclease J
MNELYSKGAEVIFQDTHVSGHPCQEEIKLIYTLVKPEFSIPVHGEYRHRVAQAKIARFLGYDSQHIIMLSSGDVLEISDEDGGKAEVTTDDPEHAVPASDTATPPAPVKEEA